MKKIIDFMKKPLLYISSAILAVFTVVLVLLACLPHGNKYVYAETIAGIDIEYTFTFDDDEVLFEMYALGEYNEIEYDFEIKKGELFVKEERGTEWEKLGKINVYEMTLVSEESGVKLELVLECKLTKVLKVLSIVLMSVSGTLLLASVAVIVLDKKGLIKFKKATVAADAVEETVVVEESPTSVEETVVVEESSAEEPKTEE